MYTPTIHQSYTDEQTTCAALICPQKVQHWTKHRIIDCHNVFTHINVTTSLTCIRASDSCSCAASDSRTTTSG